MITYSRDLPKISKIVRQNRNSSCIKKYFKGLFQNEQITAFTWNKNLKDITGCKKTKSDKVRKLIHAFTQRKCSGCFKRTENLYCINTNIQEPAKTKVFLKIFHNINWKSEYVTQLMECILCNKKYLGKTKTAFTNDPNGILACEYFQL